MGLSPTGKLSRSRDLIGTSVSILISPVPESVRHMSFWDAQKNRLNEPSHILVGCVFKIHTSMFLYGK